MVYWIFFLTLALGVAGMLAFGGPELQTTATARLSFFALALTFVLSVLAAFLRSHGTSRRPPGTRRS
jgi:uncharacterized membrane protein YtjA (UPF0391 family)